MRLELNKGQYIQGDTVELFIDSNNIGNRPSAQLYQGCRRINCDIVMEKAGNSYTVRLSGLPIGNYIISVKQQREIAETAFDIVESRGKVVRYGFLTDFTNENNVDIQAMKDWHLNAVQFYDWMYRHDRLVSKEDEYLDPLGRKISKKCLREKINDCKEAGIRPIAYGAVYAATKETYDKHPDWALYTMDGEAMLFANWLYYMNIAEDSGWKSHILEEYKEAVADLGFQGIHMDTYGFPKNVFNAGHEKVNLADQFLNLINDAAKIVKDIDKENGVIFNAVNNWPIESVAGSKQDVVYIEVWPPNDNYYDLYHLIRNARRLSGKNVVLAAYMKPFQGIQDENDYIRAEYAYLFANAVICASGGTQLALGGNQAILCDSYYVNHAKLRHQFLPTVKKYCDYLVAYADFMYNDDGIDVSMTASGGINEDIVFISSGAEFSPIAEPGKIWTIIREQKNRLTIHLINLSGNNGKWNEPKEKPESISDIHMKVRYDRNFTNICSASPDNQSILSESLTSEIQYGNCGRIYDIRIPELFIWRTVIIEME